MFVVDTNVLIYAADADADLHTECRARLQEWRRQAAAWYLTWGILYEFLRVSTHPRVFRRPWAAEQALGFVTAVLAAPGLRLLVAGPHHADVLASVLNELPHVRGNLMHDARTAVLMREHGIRRIYTRDTDFHRFPFLEVVDPVA